MHTDKCDELRPRCQNCINRKRECVYVPATAAVTINTAGIPFGLPLAVTTSVTATGAPSKDVYWPRPSSASVSPPSPYISSIPGTLMPSECADTPLLDRELLQHYSTHVAELIMMTGSPTERAVWEHYVPNLVVGTSYLTNSLLAFSAFHLTHATKGARDLTQWARAKYIAALRSFAADSRSGNPEALFAGSCFVMMSSYAFRDLPLVANNHSGMDLLSASRSPLAVADSMGSALHGTRIGDGVIQRREVRRDEEGPPVGKLTVIEDLLRIAQKLNTSGYFVHQGIPVGCVAPFPPPLALSPESKNYGPYYERSIGALIRCLSPSPSGDLPSRILSWPMMLSHEFIYLVRQGYPFALVITAYYAALLHYCQSYFWINDRAKREISKIWVLLDPVWRPLLLWPRALSSTSKLTKDELLLFLDQRLPKVDFDPMFNVENKTESIFIEKSVEYQSPIL